MVIATMYSFFSQKEPDNVEKPFLHLAEQFYQLYNDKVESAIID